MQVRHAARPLAIAHRGLPMEHPENTMKAFRAALDAGADGLETDLVLTRDRHVVLWHDPTPSGFGPTVRKLGLEPGTRFKPVWPEDARPVHEMDLGQVRRDLGYRGPGGRSAEPVPTVEQLLDLAARDPRCKRLMLEVKLPPGRTDLAVAMARRLGPAIDQRGLRGRVVLFGFDAATLAAMRRELGPGHPMSLTLTSPAFTLKRPDPKRYSALDAALKHGFEIASVGRQRLLDFFGWKRGSFLDGLRRDRARIDASGKPRELAVWTINDPRGMREVRDAGATAIITDDVRTLRQVLDGR